MKKIVVILSDGYDDAISITAIGARGAVTNISTGLFEVSNKDILIFPDGRAKKKNVKADVIKVIRCKNCNWHDSNGDCINPKCTKSYYGCRTNDDFYCGHAEEKE